MAIDSNDVATAKMSRATAPTSLALSPEPGPSAHRRAAGFATETSTIERLQIEYAKVEREYVTLS